ncbi:MULTISPECIES: DNA repair protein RecN [Burkholderia]|uniref:DNA repair protein RecN n=1 Tax=Burkholderia ambifaria (strain ATCC BAA-244 / DSM 16087 / CCUG 44356 / LMG 19182 / AMMD) TaxID=339670 RepID=Q0BI27_BURCM|nr:MULTISPECIES: DNA repair protein RecN [Burkholderia]MDP9586122.1 DNA repair protein RecN (Recombination protein N) [Burkholderia contaminans]ABI86196.1 DNA replication and repair protein RecN [Burkholderia ambifaria AMMD]AJY20832.1 DNA repair protein RecN [Burkholderia ambifaria AMMD]MBR7934727.1 DNA repair protein RecN [Burkholderia ambifaria]MBR8065778.1 DNA repair protein RecN [Burkholderia ambifaria]
MLRHLSIRDFVIVAALDLEFDSGFTVFSGETGAGKSILIDALALALGERADASVVRAGCGRADITAEFTPHDRVARWLDEHAFDAEDTVMLRRVIDANGRSRAFINGTSATLAQLRELGEMLVDIHGQHAHQLLMRPDAQRELFDTHAGLVADAANVARAWRVWRDATQAIDAAKAHERELQLEREKLAWQLAELDKLAPQPGEWDEVGSEHKRLSHSANLIAGVQGALNALSEADDAMLPQLGAIVSKLRNLADYDTALGDALASLEPAEIQLQEAVYSLSHYAQRLDLDPARLAQVEARLDALHTTARKFRLPPGTLHEEHAARRAQLAALDAAADLGALEAAQAKAWETYLADAKHLSKARTQAAKALGTAVTAGMQELSMAGGSFEVALVPLADGGPHGLEQVEFRVAGHPGVPLRPLAKVASGGELARISLALAVIASAASPTPTLIFDEVDTGIGGGVAEVVGRLLHQLGRDRQVLCVTHLPQVAARGDHHYQVAKGADDRGGTVSSVIPLDKASRVEEVARMLGGLEITATTRKHAKEMLAA